VNKNIRESELSLTGYDFFRKDRPVSDSKGMDGPCYKCDVRQSHHLRLSDWLVVNGGVTEIASL